MPEASFEAPEVGEKPSHYISGYRKVTFPERVVYLDTETAIQAETPEVQYQVFRLGWCCYARRKGGNTWSHDWQYYGDRTGMVEGILKFIKKSGRTFVIASNVVFDCWVLRLYETLQREGWTLDFLYDQGISHILVARREKASVVFCAIQNWYPFSIARIGKEVGIEKKDCDPLNDPPEKVKQYCRVDVEIMVEAMERWFGFLQDYNLGKFCYTLASQAYSTWRYRFLAGRVLVHREAPILELERQAYHGGRVECFHIGAYPRPVVQLDINSLYPFCMKHTRVPTEVKNYVENPRPGYVEDQLSDRCVVAEIEVDTDDPAYAVRSADGLIFPVGRFRCFVCSPGMRYAIEHGHIVKIHRVAVYNGAVLFEPFVDYFYGLRLECRKRGETLRAYQAKRLLNSLYGKFGQAPPQVVEWQRTGKPGVLRESYVDLDTGKRYMRSRFLGVEWLESGRVEGNDSCPAIAAHITEAARFTLWAYAGLLPPGDLLYCDTDSLTIPEDSLSYFDGAISDTELGALKVEWWAESACFFGAKDYVLGSKVKIKGVRATAEKIAPDRFRQELFPGLWSLLSEADPGVFPVYRIEKHLSREYKKGEVSDDGTVTPRRIEFSPVLPLVQTSLF